MLGLAYLSVLLQNPGKPMRGLELQNATGGPFVSLSSAKLVSDSLAHESESEDAENRLPSSQNDFSRVDVLSDKARRRVAARLLEIEKDLAYKGEIQDIQGVDALQKEYSFLKSYLGSSLNIHRRPRTFADENEKARTSITNALNARAVYAEQHGSADCRSGEIAEPDSAAGRVGELNGTENGTGFFSGPS